MVSTSSPTESSSTLSAATSIGPTWAPRTPLAGSGVRIGEALGLRHSDIDAAALLVSVVPRVNLNRARAKGAGGRRVPVQAGVIRRYADYLHGEPKDVAELCLAFEVHRRLM
jgi:integrase